MREDCTAKRRSYQGAVQGACARQHRGNPQRASGGRGRKVDPGSPI